MDTVYIETSIPSTYFEQRPDAKLVARKEWTRDWWDNHRHKNMNKIGHIRRVNTLLGLPVPLLITPLQLLGEPRE